MSDAENRDSDDRNAENRDSDGRDSSIRRWTSGAAGAIGRIWTDRRLPGRDPDRSGEKSAESSSDAQPKAPPEDPADRATRRLQHFLEQKDVEAAAVAFKNSRRNLADWRPPERAYLELIQGIVHAARWDDAVEILPDYLQNSPKPDVRVRLKLAQIFVKHRGRPAKALDVLGAIPPGALPANLEATRAELARRAAAMIEEGVLEIDDDRP